MRGEASRCPDEQASSGRDRRVIYVAYNSAFHPLVESQVVAYLRELHRMEGLRFRLLTFEPRTGPLSSSAGTRHALAERLRSLGVEWIALPYHARPSLLATVWDVLAGWFLLAREIARERPTLLHARSHVAAAMAWLAGSAFHVPFVFDCRGLLADEYADVGHWARNSWKYRLTKRAERSLFHRAAHVVVLTNKLRSMLIAGDGLPQVAADRITVVPCCVDLDRFTPRHETRDPDVFTLCYLGSVGTWYLLPEMLDFVGVARTIIPGLRLLVLNQGEHTLIDDEVRRRGLESITTIRAATPEEVPRYLEHATAGIAFIKPSFSKQASSPTKLGEYLAAGLPVVANVGVGDTDELLRDVGILVRHFTPGEYERAALQLRDLVLTHRDLVSTCRTRAEEELGLDEGVRRYGAVYRKVLTSRR